MLFLVVFAPVLIMFWAVISWARLRLWILGQQLPGPAGWPIVGNLLLLRDDPKQSFQKLVRILREFGPVVRFWMGPKLIVFVSDPNDIQKILGNPAIRNRDRVLTEAMAPFLGNGLITARGELWKTHRKFLAPMFYFKVLSTYIDVFGEKSKILATRLCEVADGRTIDFYKYVSNCSIDSVCETVIGCQVKYQEGGQFDGMEGIIDQVNELVQNRIKYPYLLIKWLYPFTRDGRKAASIMKILHDAYEPLIANKLKAHRTGKLLEGDRDKADRNDKEKVLPLLDLLIASSERADTLYSPQEMRDELLTTAVTGSEGAAITISNLCLLLGMHPEVQDGVRRELHEIFGGADDQRLATLCDISKMVLIESAIKETLRLFPPAALISRELDEDVFLNSGQIQDLPSGSTVLILTYSVHRNEKYFPNANSFLPERWQEETARHPYSYLPFGAGARQCIGQKYAMLEMQSIVSTIFRKFKVTTNYTMKDMDKLMAMKVSLKLSSTYEIQLRRLTEKSVYKIE